MCKKIVVAVSIVSSCIACNTENEIKGVILERKRVNDSTTNFIYTYMRNNKSTIDSQTIVNTILPNDTINLSFNNNKPLIKP